MQTYLELEDQAAKLLKQAENLRLQERAAAIKAMKAQIAQYGITAEDLDLVPQPKTRNAEPVAAKYRGPNGELWGGGRGRKPDWVRQVLKAGKSIEDYAIRAPH